MPVLPGAHLGPSEVVAAVGMGEVYRARVAPLGREAMTPTMVVLNWHAALSPR